MPRPRARLTSAGHRRARRGRDRPPRRSGRAGIAPAPALLFPAGPSPARHGQGRDSETDVRRPADARTSPAVPLCRPCAERAGLRSSRAAGPFPRRAVRRGRAPSAALAQQGCRRRPRRWRRRVARPRRSIPARFGTLRRDAARPPAAALPQQGAKIDRGSGARPRGHRRAHGQLSRPGVAARKPRAETPCDFSAWHTSANTLGEVWLGGRDSFGGRWRARKRLRRERPANSDSIASRRVAVPPDR